MKRQRRRWRLDRDVGPIPQGAFRPPRPASLLRDLSHHRPLGRRRGRLGRLFRLLSRFLRLADLPDRPKRDRDHQYDGRDNGSQNACYFFRIHFDISISLGRFPGFDSTENRPLRGKRPSVYGRIQR